MSKRVPPKLNGHCLVCCINYRASLTGQSAGPSCWIIPPDLSGGILANPLARTVHNTIMSIALHAHQYSRIILQVVHDEYVVVALIDVVNPGTLEEWFSWSHLTSVPFEPQSLILHATKIKRLLVVNQIGVYLFEASVSMACMSGDGTGTLLVLSHVGHDGCLRFVQNGCSIIEDILFGYLGSRGSKTYGRQWDSVVVGLVSQR